MYDSTKRIREAVIGAVGVVAMLGAGCGESDKPTRQTQAAPAQTQMPNPGQASPALEPAPETGESGGGGGGGED